MTSISTLWTRSAALTSFAVFTTKHFAYREISTPLLGSFSSSSANGSVPSDGSPSTSIPAPFSDSPASPLSRAFPLRPDLVLAFLGGVSNGPSSSPSAAEVVFGLLEDPNGRPRRLRLGPTWAKSAWMSRCCFSTLSSLSPKVLKSSSASLSKSPMEDREGFSDSSCWSKALKDWRAISGWFMHMAMDRRNQLFIRLISSRFRATCSWQSLWRGIWVSSSETHSSGFSPRASFCSFLSRAFSKRVSSSLGSHRSLLEYLLYDWNELRWISPIFLKSSKIFSIWTENSRGNIGEKGIHDPSQYRFL